MTKLCVICGAVAALLLSAGNVSAQDNGGGGGGGFGGGGPGGGGGGFGGGGGGFGGGNFDPAAMQQRMLDNIRTQLNFTNDTDWNAVQPLVQKVLDAQTALRGFGGGGRMMFGRGGRGGGNGGPGGGNGGGRRGGMFGGTPAPEQTALQTAVEINAPADQLKDLLAKYEAARAAKQGALKSAQDNLRGVLTVPQEASATLLGLLE